MAIFYYVAAFILGIVIPLQSLVNNQLRQQIGGSPIVAAFISFCIGTLILGTLCLITRPKMPDIDVLRQLSWWQWTGGLLGTMMVFGTIFLVPKIGSANMLSLIISAQILAALVFDRTGWVGAPLKEVTPVRIIGALLIIGGTLLVTLFSGKK